MPLGANKAALLGMGGVSAADVILISTTTLSGNSEVEFAAFSSDYSSLIWQFVGLNPSAHDSDLTFQTRVSGGSYANATTTGAYRYFNRYDGNTNGLQYQTSYDAGNSTVQIPMNWNVDDGTELAGSNNSGYFQLFNPTSSSLFKTFSSLQDGGIAISGGGACGYGSGGWVNTTTALEAIEFKFNDPTATMDAGKILYWGVI